MIDIGNAIVLGCAKITTKQICEILGVKPRFSLDDAIILKKSPLPYDKLGPDGTQRWFVGQFRAWYMHDYRPR